MIPLQNRFAEALTALFTSRKFSRRSLTARRRLTALRAVTARQRFGMASRAATLAAAGVLAFAGVTRAAVFTKNATAGDLSVGTTWVNGTVPGGSDVALFNNTVTAAQVDNITAANLTLGELQIVNPGGAITINGPQALTLNGINGVGIDMSAATQNLTIGAAVTLGNTQAWNVATGRTLTINAPVSGGANGITINGPGSVTFTANAVSTYTGTTTVNNGALFLDSSTTVNNVLSPSSTLAVGGGTVDFVATTTVQTQAFAGTVINPGAGVFIQGRGSNGRMTTALGTVTRGGVGGTVVIDNTSNSSTFSTTSAGTNGIIGGWAVFGNNSASTAATDFARSATTQGTALAIAAPTYTSDTWAAANNTNVTLAANTQTNATTNSLRFAVATTSDTITLSGTNIISSGGILLSGAITGANDVITGGTLEGAAGADLVVNQFAQGTTSSLAINSIIADNTSATALTKTGPGLLTLGGANTFTGGIFLNAGTIQLTTGGSLNGNALTFTNSSAGVLSLGGVSATIGALTTSALSTTLPVVQNANATAATLTINSSTAGTYAGILANGTGGGTLGLTLTGTGVQTLTGANTYTGPTNVNGGTLFVGTGGTISTSTAINVGSAGTLNVTTNGLTIPSGNTLAGGGSVLGAVSISSGGILSPGNGAVATLSIGSLTLNGSSVTNFAFGTGNSQVSTGALTLNGTDGINLYQAGTTNQFSTPGTYTLFTDTSLSGTGTFSVLNAAGGESYAFSTAGNTVTLTIASTGGVVSAWNVDASSNYNNAANWTNGVPNTASAVATFGSVITAPRTVSVDGTFTLGEIDFNNANSYTLTPAAAGNGFVFNNGTSAAVLNDINGSHTVQTPIALALGLNVTVTNAANTLTVSGAISNTGAAGTGTLTKSGAGTLALLGTNTFDGGVDITNGTVQINSASSLGATTGTATLDSSANAVTLEALNSITTARVFTLNGTSSNLQVDGTSTYEIDGIIGQGSNGGTLTKTGTGTLTLGGNNTFLGIVTISAGALSLGAGGTAGSVSGNIIDNGAVTLNRTDTYTLGNMISGTGSLTQTGSGNTTLSAANTFTGTTTVAAGTLTLSNALALQNSTLNYGAGGTLSFGTLTAATLGGLSGTGTLALANTSAAAVTLTLGSNNGTSSFAGNLSGAGSLAKIGTGIVTLAGAGATYTGNTTIYTGGVVFGGTTSMTGAGNFDLTGALGTTSYLNSLTFQDNAVINTTGFLRIASNDGQNANNYPGAGTVLVKNAASVTVGSLSFGNGSRVPAGNSVTVQDTASLAVTGALTLESTLGTTVSNNAVNLNGGTLAVGSFVYFTSTAGGATINFNGGVLQALASDTSATVPFLAAATRLTTVVNAGGAIINTNGFSDTITTALTHGTGTPDGGLTKNGAGTLTLTAGNSYTGLTTINAGTLNINGEFALGGAVYGGTTFNGGTLQYAAGFTGNGTGDISQNSAAIPVAKPVTFTSTATIDVNGNAVTYANPVGNGGAGGLTVVSTTAGGSLTLGGANTYTGATTVSSGALYVNGSVGATGAPSGALSVPVGSTVGGTGILTVASATVGGTLAPGAAAGATTGALTLNTTSGFTLSGTLTIALNSTGGVSSGTLLNTGALTLSGATLSLTGTAADGTTTYDLVNYTGPLTGTFANANVPSGYTINYAGTTFSSSDIELDPITAVPEPGTWLGGALLVLGLGWNVNRRRSRAVRA